MATRRLSRNDTCHCGSGRKYKKCCLATDLFPRQGYAIEHPQPVYGEGATLTRANREAARSDPPQLDPIVRVGVDYTFDETFGRAEVGYSFPLGQLVILDTGFVLPVERLEPGMRMRLEDGHIAIVTGVDEPKTWEPPSRTPDSDGRYARRVLGTIKRTGYVVFDLIAGGQSITTTPGHPFWSVDRRSWVAAGELRVGERLRTGDGSSVPVEGKSPLRRELIELYNIEVEEFHTYFVGSDIRSGILAHNGLGGDCGIPKPASTPVGRKGNPLGAVHPNPPTTINGRPFSGHAIDQMQARGIPPSAVDNALQHGTQLAGKRPGTTAYQDLVNDITVITDTATGRVITVGHGLIRQ
jgi:hypothetical protein